MPDLTLLKPFNLDTTGSFTFATANVTGNITSGNASLGNLVTANYFSGNGSLLTGLPAGYANTNVAAYLPTYTGNVSANYFIGNGSLLTFVTGSNVNGQVGNALIAGTVYTNAQPNITSVGTLASLTVTANISSGNANLGNLATASYFSGNGIYISNIAGANVSGIVANATYATSAGSATSATTADTVTTNAQPNITSVGTLSSLTVTANITSGNANLGNLATATYFTGNGSLLTYITGSNVNGNVTSAVQSHYANIANSVAGANVSGQVSNALVAGTVYTNAQPNITSLGTLTSLSLGGMVTGDIIPNANVTYSLGNSTNRFKDLWISGSTINLGDANISATGNTIALEGANINGALIVTGDATVTGNLTVGGNTTYVNVETFAVEDPIIELGGGVNGAPLTTNDGKDRGTLLHYYTTGVIDAFMGWDNSNGEFAFGSNVSVSSEVVTFNTFGNVRANNFLGAATTAGTVTTNAQPNITSVGTLSSLDVTANITSGNANLGNLVTASYFTGNGIYISNIAGANVSGVVANATYATTAGTVTTNAQPNITSVGTLASLTVTANITSGNSSLGNLATATYFSGNGIYISNIAGANVSGVVANATYATSAGSATSATTADTVTTNAQPNITSVGTLAGLTGTGVFNLTGTSNVALGAVANVHISGGTSGYVLSTDGSGTLSWVAQTTSSSYGNSNVADYLPTYTGNVSANYFIGNGATLTYITGSNVNGQVGNATVAGTVYTNAQPNITSVGTLVDTTLGTSNSFTGGNLVGATYLTGTLTTGAQANITSVGSLSSLTVTGRITATGTGLKAANIEDSSGTITIVTGYGSVSGAVGVYGNITVGTSGTGFFIGNGSYLSGLTGGNVSGQVGNALVAGTVYTAAQPNITSVGSLSGLTVSNATGVVNFTTTANVTLGNVSNLHISGGSANYILQTNGSGTLSWVAQSGGGATITDDTSTNATYYPVYATASSGTLSTAGISSTKLQFNPSLGQMTVTDLNSLSDATLKTNWQTIDDPFSILDQLFGMGFEWTDNGRKSYGLSAQNVEQILPELVGMTAQGKKTVNYIPIIAFLLEALKKNNKELQEIKNSIKPKRQRTKKDK